MKVIKSIPNFITCLNLLSGACAIVFSFKGYFDYALYFILIAAVFDFADGLAARMLNAYSETGKELDSLSDVVSFGVAPAMMMYNYMEKIIHLPWYISSVALLLAVFSALRLARFNTDDSQKNAFVGLATPASAILAASLVSSAYDMPRLSFLVNNLWFFPIVTVLLCTLLVSHIPMFSFKMKNLGWADNKCRYVYIIMLAVLSVCISLTAPFAMILVGAVCLYIVFNIVTAAFGK